MRLIEYHAAHGQAVLGYSGTSPDVESAERVLGWLRRHGKPAATESDLWRGLSRGFPCKTDLAAALAVLEERGWIRRLADRPRTGPGRPKSPEWSVHPAALPTDPPE